MLLDHVHFLTRNLEAAAPTFELIANVNCIDPEIVENAEIRRDSLLFRFHRVETPFSYITNAWYGPYFNMNGQRIPIAREGCGTTTNAPID